MLCAPTHLSGRRFSWLLALATLPLLAAAPHAGAPDPCALITQSEAAAAMGTPAKAAVAGHMLTNCTYAADLPTTDPRAQVDRVVITIQDDAMFDLPRKSKAFHIENVAVGDDAYYYWSGQYVVTGLTLALKQHGTVVLIALSAYQGAKTDPKSMTVAEIKTRELTLAKAAVKRIP
jgi:hypothetical protein